MINLRLRTEFTFNEAYGPVEKVLDAAAPAKAAGVADRGGTWGHVQFSAAAKRRGVKPVLGVELAVVQDATAREKQPTCWMAFLARNGAGLSEVYRLASLATSAERFYYNPRLEYGDLYDVSENVYVLTGTTPLWSLLPRRLNLFAELAPTSQKQTPKLAAAKGMPLVATSDNFYPAAADRKVYEVRAGSIYRDTRVTPMHVLQEWEWREFWDEPEALANAQLIADACDAPLPRARMPTVVPERTLEETCRANAPARGVDLSLPEYAARLRRELDLIAEKDFADYFYIVADLVYWAKFSRKMLVGPARGSSCGSLVCYLAHITDIDPIPNSLLFERFIDVNRKDYPDIDIDFPHGRRDEVFAYLAEKYGEHNVARIGTVGRFGTKSTIQHVAGELDVPPWEVKEFKDQIIERSSGDARAGFCVMDSFDSLEVGKKLLAKYPQMRVAAELENHVSHTGQHAAGVVVTAGDIRDFCTVDAYRGVIQADKKDAEKLNLLKIDALALRTLDILADCLAEVGKDAGPWLLAYPRDDQRCFDILNRGRYAGVFQFEGRALQELTRQIRVSQLEDIAALTALCRPGPLISGGAASWVARRTGKEPVKYIHPLVRPMTEVTMGIVVYQEQVMQIAREVGRLTWEDVSSLRKAMSSSLGKEFFDKYWERFAVGAREQGVADADAKEIWENINTMGSWSFNRSHAVAYGLVSYWTLVLKANFPLEFAAATLREPKNDEQSVKLLRELKKEGYDFKAFDAQLSEKNWIARDGKLVGGLVNVRGIGDKAAEEILARRKAGLPLTPGMAKKLAEGRTPFDSVFECTERFADVWARPEAYNVVSKLSRIEDITGDESGTFVFFGKITKLNPRDLNEPILVQKRNGRVMKGQTQFLNVTVEDDTGPMSLSVDRFKFLRLGKPLIETAKEGDWYLWKGRTRRGFRRVDVDAYRRMEGDLAALRTKPPGSD